MEQLLSLRATLLMQDISKILWNSPFWIGCMRVQVVLRFTSLDQEMMGFKLGV